MNETTLKSDKLILFLGIFFWLYVPSYLYLMVLGDGMSLFQAFTVLSQR